MSQKELEALRQTLASIENGSHPDYVSQSQSFEKQCKDACAAADKRHSAQAQTYAKMYDMELNAARRHREDEKQTIIERYKKEISQKISVMKNKLKKGVEPTSTIAGSGESRVRLQIAAVPKCAEADLRSIAQHWHTRAVKYQQNVSGPSCRWNSARQSHTIDDVTFTRGAFVIITITATQEFFFGTISNLSEDQIVVEHDSGNLSRVPIQHIKTGRCVLQLDDGE